MKLRLENKEVFAMPFKIGDRVRFVWVDGVSPDDLRDYHGFMVVITDIDLLDPDHLYEGEFLLDRRDSPKGEAGEVFFSESELAIAS